MPQKIQLRRGTAAQWTAANPLLQLGEPGLETDTRRVKYGDGVQLWNSLAYASGGSAVTLDSDGTLTVDGTAIELATDGQIVGKLDATAKAADTAKVNGVTVTGTPGLGNVLTATSSTAAGWSAPSAGAGDATSGAKGVVQLAGDLAGSAASPQVTATHLAAALPLGQGGTGGADAATARSNLAVPATLDALKGWATSASFWFSAAPTYTSGTITGGNIVWPDGSTGVYTATSVDTNGAVAAFTASTTGGQLGSKTVTVTIPRDASSNINAAMTVAVA